MPLAAIRVPSARSQRIAHGGARLVRAVPLPYRANLSDGRKSAGRSSQPHAHGERSRTPAPVGGGLGREQRGMRGLFRPSLRGRFAMAPSGSRQTTAWLSAKRAHITLTLDDAAVEPMRRFAGLAAMSLGLEGKRGLWQILSVFAPTNPLLQGLAYAHRMRCAEEQRGRLDAVGHPRTDRLRCLYRRGRNARRPGDRAGAERSRVSRPLCAPCARLLAREGVGLCDLSILAQLF
jgi:hypothetical protein